MYIRNIVYIVILFLNVIDYIIVLVGIKSYFGNNLSDDEKKISNNIEYVQSYYAGTKRFCCLFQKKDISIKNIYSFSEKYIDILGKDCHICKRNYNINDQIIYFDCSHSTHQSCSTTACAISCDISCDICENSSKV